MQDDDPDDIASRAVNYAIAARPFAHTEDYAQRGRVLKHLTADELQRGFEGAMREWVAAPSDRQKSDRHSDFEAEFALRGQEPDYSKVKAEINAISELAASAASGLSDEQRAAMGQSLIDDYESARGKQN